jgi:hypothetical protein
VEGGASIRESNSENRQVGHGEVNYHFTSLNLGGVFHTEFLHRFGSLCVGFVVRSTAVGHAVP